MTMNHLSKSTKLLNCLVALTRITPDFPHPLFDGGFQLEGIEPHFLLSDGSDVNPDIQIKKNDDYLIFFECKNGYAEDAQREKYKKVTLSDIKNAQITTLPASEFHYDIAYFCTSEKEDKLIKSMGEDVKVFPVILLEDNRIVMYKNSCNFKIEGLNSIFKEIVFKNRPPESFIPFTPDDPTEIIEINLLRHFVAKSDCEFSLDELIRELFPLVIDNYSHEGKETLKGRIGNILTTLQQSEDFRNFITHNGGKYQIRIITPRKFKNACVKLRERLEKNKNQAKLDLGFGVAGI